jgi:hypothetical protein
LSPLPSCPSVSCHKLKQYGANTRSLAETSTRLSDILKPRTVSQDKLQLFVNHLVKGSLL